jgi:hypothetical protein
VIFAVILGFLNMVVSSGVPIVDNQKEPTEKQIKQMMGKALVFTFVLIPSIFIGLCVLVNEFAFKTPLVRSFDDAAERAKIAACESRHVWGDKKSSDECP